MNLLANEIHFARSYTITYFSVFILHDFSGALNMVNSPLILIFCQFPKYHRLLIFLDPHCNIPSSCHVEPCSSTWLLRIVIHWSPVLGLLLSSWVSSFMLMTHRYIPPARSAIQVSGFTFGPAFLTCTLHCLMTNSMECESLFKPSLAPDLIHICKRANIYQIIYARNISIIFYFSCSVTIAFNLFYLYHLNCAPFPVISFGNKPPSLLKQAFNWSLSFYLISLQYFLHKK